MSKSQEIIVIKFGSGILTHPDGISLDDSQFDGLVNAVSNIHKIGMRPVIVSSGAAAAGMMAFGIKETEKFFSYCLRIHVSNNCLLRHMKFASGTRD